MTRRNLELILLCLAAPLVVLLFAMIALNQGSDLNLTTLGVPIGVFLAFIAAHLAVRKFTPAADPCLLPISFALSGIGIAFVTRLAPELAVNQVIWLFLGIACMVGVLIISRNLDKIVSYKYTFMILGFLLLLCPLIPGLGQELYGSQIWISVAGFSFQPGEIAKIAIVLFLAGYLAQNRELLSVFTWRVGIFNLPDIRTLIPLLLMWGVSLVIVVFEKDLGSALVFFFIFLVMLYITTGKKFYVVAGFLLILVGGIGAYLFFDHVQIRVATWLDPFSDALDTGFQLVQATFSMADGGLFGVGLGNGFATIIPIVESDFIFAAIAEEIGLLGAAGVLLLFLCLAIRGFATAARAKSDVSCLIAAGLTSIIVLQAFIIVGGVTRLIPLTGLTLPFISQGGSSLVASFISIGLLLRCGDEATGVGTELAEATGSMSPNSVLGRISLGKRLTHTILVCSALFALLVANLTMIMVVQADYYQNMSGNSHTALQEAYNKRGTISTSDGVVLAESVLNDDGTYDRVYPAGDLATHVVGYSSTIYGTTGIEAYSNSTLTGESNFATWSDVLDSLTGAGVTGNDVVLTINATIQQAAQDALEGEVGAIVVMDPETGAILAMASSPTYDAEDFAEVIANAAADENSEDTSLLNRATQALYSPGSTFKIVTLTTALDNDVADEETVYSSPGSMEIGNATVSNYGNTDYGSLTLAEATWYSSNTVFGQLGTEMGADMLVEGAESFGFNQNIDFELSLYTSLMPDPDDMTVWETAWAAAGEPVGESGTDAHPSEAGPQTTVLEMALIVSAIANDGIIMQPYLIDSIYNADGIQSYLASPSALMEVVSEEIAARVKEVLVGVVEYGTGTAASIDGIEVAGKTGTAENADGNNSWFVGMAPVDDPKVVIAIIIEDAETGEATQKAQNVLETALEVLGIL